MSRNTTRENTPSLRSTPVKGSYFRSKTNNIGKEFSYQKLRRFFKSIRYAIRLCLMVKKNAIESRQVKEQLFMNKEILFDLSQYRRPVEETIGRNVRKILKSYASLRTDEDVRMVVLSLGQTVSSFTEFPLARQYSIARVARLEEFDAGRVIIREGHRAEKFYLIVDGIT
ncbi:unnamed protein product, partial [Didymodactylos carnosus]